jgi:hypothetical protein
MQFLPRKTLLNTYIKVFYARRDFPQDFKVDILIDTAFKLIVQFLIQERDKCIKVQKTNINIRNSFLLLNKYLMIKGLKNGRK